MSRCHWQLFFLFFNPRQPGEHPKILGEHGPAYLKTAMGEALGPGNPVEKVVFQDPDPPFALTPAVLGGGKNFVVFDAVLEFLGIARA